MRDYNMYNLRDFARVYRITTGTTTRATTPSSARDARVRSAAADSTADSHDESVAPVRAFGKMRTLGNSHPA